MSEEKSWQSARLVVAEALALSGIHHSPDGREALRRAGAEIAADVSVEADVFMDAGEQESATEGSSARAGIIVDEEAFTALLKAPCDTPTLWLVAVALEQYWRRELADSLICGCTTLEELLALPWVEN